MSPLTAITWATATMLALGASSLSGQIETGAVITKPMEPRPTAQPTVLRPPAAPTNLTVTPAGLEATLSWDSVPGVKGYRVTRTSALHGNILQTPTPITSTSFTDVSQQFDPRYLYTYSVYALHTDGRTGLATVTYLPPPASVSGPTYSGSCYGAGAFWTTSWTGVPEATGYVIRYKMHMTNHRNSYYTKDTSIAVAAPATTHSVRQFCSFVAYVYGPDRVSNPSVSAVFANGARSAATSPR